MKSWKIGDVVCDMHYGLPDHSGYPEKTPLECRNHTRIRTYNSSDVFNLVLQGVGLILDHSYGNKYAVVVDYGFDGWLTAIYSYDNRCFGTFEFRNQNKEN